MTTLLYLSPQFPENFTQFVIRAAKHGVKVLGISSDHYEWLSEDLRSALTEYWRVNDVHNYEEILWAAKELAARHGGIDIIESQTEFWFLTEARLRDALGVPGLSEREAYELQKKSYMKELFQRAGVDVVPGKVVGSLIEAREFFQQINSAVVLKPNRGVGATNTYRVDDATEFDHYASLIEGGVFIEKFIDGELLTFDGLVDHEGKIVYWSSFHYNKPVMELVNQNEIVYYYTAREIETDLELAGRAYIQQIALRQKFFHLEFFRSYADGKLYGLEANLRPPGGPTVDLWNYADNIDLYDGWAQIITHKPFSTPWSRNFHVCYVGRKFGRAYALEHDEVLHLLGNKLVSHEPISGLFRDAMGDYCYIIRSHDLPEIKQLAIQIHAQAA